MQHYTKPFCDKEFFSGLQKNPFFVAISSPALAGSIKDEPAFYYGSSDHNKLCCVKFHLTPSSHSTSQSERVPTDTPSIVGSSLSSSRPNRSWRCAGNFHYFPLTLDFTIKPDDQRSSYQILLCELDQVNYYEFALIS